MAEQKVHPLFVSRGDRQQDIQNVWYVRALKQLEAVAEEENTR